MGRVAGKTALVTGGASGIGLACALLLLKEGARVLVGDINDRGGEAFLAETRSFGSAAAFRHLDVSAEQDWRDAVAAVKSSFGRLDVLVNNAGIGIGGPITELSLEEWRRQQAVNLDGTFLGIKHALPLMREGGGGSIINMSSVTALVGSGTFVSYSAAKGGVRSLTKSVARQCAALKDGVRVNSIHPGIIDTPIFETLGGAGASGDPHAMAKAMVPMGHMGAPSDIAAAVLYLASDESRYVTGTEMVVDGGLIIH